MQGLLNSGLGGTYSTPQKNTSVTGAYNYVLTSSLLNEFRAGLSKYITNTSFASNSAVIGSAGIQGILTSAHLDCGRAFAHDHRLDIGQPEQLAQQQQHL